jgi:hypothetical protein
MVRHVLECAAIRQAGPSTRWPITGKPAPSLQIAMADAQAELILWFLAKQSRCIHAYRNEPVSEHYEITTELGLNGCPDDLKSHIGLHCPPIIGEL